MVSKDAPAPTQANYNMTLEAMRKNVMNGVLPNEVSTKLQQQLNSPAGGTLTKLKVTPDPKPVVQLLPR